MSRISTLSGHSIFHRSILLLDIGLILALFFTMFVFDAVSADWKADWEKTIGAAKREGSVVIYTFPGNERLFQEFQKQFPEIKPIEVTVRGSERVTRTLSERRAGKDLADLLIGGAGSAAAGLL